jgi:hypothetical protein
MLIAIAILSFFISTIVAGDDCLKAACSSTPYAETCVSVLSESWVNKPDNMCADARVCAGRVRSRSYIPGVRGCKL